LWLGRGRHHDGRRHRGGGRRAGRRTLAPAAVATRVGEAIGTWIVAGLAAQARGAPVCPTFCATTGVSWPVGALWRRLQRRRGLHWRRLRRRLALRLRLLKLHLR
jgi:hypothetical protein